MTIPDARKADMRLAGIADGASFECRICWYVYGPDEGDSTDQIAPGTPFRALPDHWRCPQCDAEPAMFLPLDA